MRRNQATNHEDDVVGPIETLTLEQVRHELDCLASQRTLCRLSPVACVRYRELSEREVLLLRHRGAA